MKSQFTIAICSLEGEMFYHTVSIEQAKRFYQKCYKNCMDSMMSVTIFNENQQVMSFSDIEN